MLFWAKTKMAAAVAVVLFMGGAVALAQTAQPGPVIAKGSIKQVGDGSVVIQDSAKSVTVTLDGSTVVKANGKVGKASDLTVGMHAIAFGEQGKPAVEIRAYTPKTALPPPGPVMAKGTIKQVGDGNIVIQDGAKSVIVTFDGSTVVKVNGKVGKASNLAVGMHAIAFGAQGKPAIEIRAYMPTAVPGGTTRKS